MKSRRSSGGRHQAVRVSCRSSIIIVRAANRLDPSSVFKVPTTHDVLTALFHPSYPKSHFDLLNLALLSLQILLFFCLPRGASKLFFFCYFVLWRGAYDAGLGWVLTKQSKRKWIVREVQRRGWLDQEKRPLVREWVKNQLAGKMGKDYSFDVRLPTPVDHLHHSKKHQDLPLEYNTWLLFRQVVDVILLKYVTVSSVPTLG